MGENRYGLVYKRVYCHASDTMPFWEGASLEWGKQYALGHVKQFVVDGDGANWALRGAQEFGSPRQAVFQLGGFHLSRACGRGYERKLGSRIYESIRAGEVSFAHALMSAAAEPETDTARRDRLHVESNVVTGMDWRNRVSDPPSDARSLGTTESNGDKLKVNRMKKRGMSCTIRGAHRMAKAIQLSRNGELTEFCRAQTRHHPGRRVVDTSLTQRRESAFATRVSDWDGVSVPALTH